MTRQATLLSILGIVLVLVAFYFFAFQPKQEELEGIRAATDEAVAEQTRLETRIAALQEVRARAPEIESALASAEAIIPRESALPSALRQLQLAADDSGTELVSVSAARPAAVPGEIVELAEIAVSLEVRGSYFQLVDFLRRVEDPAISARGIKFIAGSVALAEYPTLAASLTGRMYALLPAPAPVVTEPPADTAVEPDVEATVEEEAA